MKKEEIMKMIPGTEIDEKVASITGELKQYSTSVEDAWELREFILSYSGNVELLRFCDDYPEYCKLNDGSHNIHVWAKTMPEAITKAFLVQTFAEGLEGPDIDCHP